MLSGAGNWSEVPLQLLAELLRDLIKGIKNIAFCQKHGIQCKRIQYKIVVFCASVGPP